MDSEFKIATNDMPDSVHAYGGLSGKEHVSVSWRPDATHHSILIITEEAFLAIYNAYQASKKEGRIITVPKLL